MKLHHLKPAEGSKRSRRRVGRGRAGVRGKTAGRGTKGWGARHTPKLGFEGGQMPLQRRVPKLKGFRNPTRTEYAVINVESLGTAFEAGAEVTPEALRERGLVGKTLPIKVLGRGELDRALTVHAHAISATARAKIEGAGGTVQLVDSR